MQVVGFAESKRKRENNKLRAHDLGGKALWEARMRAGLTQEEVARRLGVSVLAVHKWEIGETCPNVERLPAIRSLFDLPEPSYRVEDHRKFSSWLQAFRSAKGITVADLSDRTGVSSHTIYLWLSRRTYPSDQHIWRLAQMAGVDAMALRELVLDDMEAHRE